ncbi:hypothetical protein R5R35_006584 [Gryllus longicercus]|uniref:Uncharacterized protein n=1 Tax=Gryllus longicercus TaxID=2509291 RepID=A0AAN9ZBX5_9ORTH
MNPPEVMMSDEPESSKPQPMAFTINFSDGKDNVSTKMFRENLAKYTRHVRNASLPNVEDSKKLARNGASAVQAVCMSPLAARKGIMSKRPGYHSEGYFSSDQEDDLRARSDIFVRKLKNIDKGIRTTNLAQEKKIMADQCSQRKVKLCIQNDPQEFGDFNADVNGQNSLMDDDDYHTPPHPPAGSPLTLPDTRDTEDWLGTEQSDDELENPSDRIDTQILDDGGGDLDDILNDSSNDTVSEAGTYTIERDNPCPEVMRARQDLENVILKIGQMQTFSEEEATCIDESTFKRSLYSDGSHWINEWATQVAKHNHNGEYEKPSMPGLPPLPVGKQQGPTPVSTSKIASPVHERHVPSAGRKFTPPTQHTGPRNLHSPLSHLTVHDPSTSNDVVNTERHSDSSLETESFLRATESVVSAMQARMSLSMDSGGESDVDTSHSYRGPEKCRPPMPTTAGERYLAARRPSNASESSGRLESRAAQSDSSSEAGENKGKKKDTTVASAPQMRYNRAFSLRRARLDCEPEPPAVDKKKKPVVNEVVPAVTNKPKKAFEPPSRATPQRTVKAKSPKPETFSRTDSGRFSMRATKPAPQNSHPTTPAVPKKDSKRSAGGRSNSTLSSREVEFQNWKRRKSYDPMKAAAEGKKKEAAKKASMSTSMTQASIVDPETSPSHQNPVLRSASFHGTGGMTPNYVSSEEEVTLSADEDSPISGCPPSLIASSSPSKAILEGAFGGSRTSLHSTASNSSLGRRAKLEALDSLVMAAVCGLSNKLRGHSCKLLKKLRYLYEEDSERAEKLSDVIDLLETTAPPDSPQSKSPSKELSGTLKNLKRIETVFKVLDDVLFDEEDFEQEMDSYQ